MSWLRKRSHVPGHDIWTVYCSLACVTMPACLRRASPCAALSLLSYSSPPMSRLPQGTPPSSPSPSSPPVPPPRSPPPPSPSPHVPPCHFRRLRRLSCHNTRPHRVCTAVPAALTTTAEPAAVTSVASTITATSLAACLATAAISPPSPPLSPPPPTPPTSPPPSSPPTPSPAPAPAAATLSRRRAPRCCRSPSRWRCASASAAACPTRAAHDLYTGPSGHGSTSGPALDGDGPRLTLAVHRAPPPRAGSCVKARARQAAASPAWALNLAAA